MTQIVNASAKNDAVAPNEDPKLHQRLDPSLGSWSKYNEIAQHRVRLARGVFLLLLANQLQAPGF
jgi:hypothetical protein